MAKNGKQLWNNAEHWGNFWQQVNGFIVNVHWKKNQKEKGGGY